MNFFNTCNNYNIQPILENVFFFLSKALTNINNNVTYVYNNNIICRNIIDYIDYSVRYGKSMLYQYKIEPLLDNWLCIGSLYKKYNNKQPYTYSFYDFYNNFSISTSNNFEHSIDLYINWYESCANLNLLESTIDDCIVIMKYNGFYINRICNKSIHVLTPIKEIKKSSVRFLSIEYIHDNLENPIILSFDKGYYISDNEILSASFIRKLLEYQSEKYVFDMNYRIRIMDNNIHTFELNSNQYILLKELDYKIISNN